LKISAASNEFSDFWPQYSTSFIIVLFDLQQVSSLIVCHVFRVSPEVEVEVIKNIDIIILFCGLNFLVYLVL